MKHETVHHLTMLQLRHTPSRHRCAGTAQKLRLQQWLGGKDKCDSEDFKMYENM